MPAWLGGVTGGGSGAGIFVQLSAGHAGLLGMRLLTILLTLFFAVLALLAAAGLVLRRARVIFRGTAPRPRPQVPASRVTKSSNEVIEVEATVVSIDQGDK